MIAIGHVLVSDEVLEENFVCDLSACKGGCCVDGDCGAPLTPEEAEGLAAIYPQVMPDLAPQARKIIEEEGFHSWDDEFGYVTPVVEGGICAYAYYDEDSIVKCGIEKAWLEGKIGFQKPISCHLYPIRVKVADEFELVNFEPRKKLCKPACKLGNKLKVPVYKFLETPIKRKFGDEVYEALDAYAKNQII